jgi:chorismate--pyruvate lyase
LIRNVLLLGNRQAVVFAHSVLPLYSLRGPWLGLRQLGNQPLGEALFANPQVKRTALRFQKLHARHALYQQAVANIDPKPHYLWARRSVFHLHKANIMVTEVFLPELVAAK